MNNLLPDSHFDDNDDEKRGIFGSIIVATCPTSKSCYRNEYFSMRRTEQVSVSITRKERKEALSAKNDFDGWMCR